MRDPHDVPVMEPQKQEDGCLSSSYENVGERGEARVSVVRLRMRRMKEVVVRILTLVCGREGDLECLGVENEL